MGPDDYISKDEDVDERQWTSPAKAAHDDEETPKVTVKYAQPYRPTYEEQQQREENLRRELESVRQVNETIEGLIHSLGKAKDNMKVRMFLSSDSAQLTRITDGKQHSNRGIYPIKHLDTNSITNRAQPALDPGSIMAWRKSRYSRH